MIKHLDRYAAIYYVVVGVFWSRILWSVTPAYAEQDLAIRAVLSIGAILTWPLGVMVCSVSGLFWLLDWVTGVI